MSTAAERARRRAQADKAYEIQFRAASLGAIKFTALGTAVITGAHYGSPAFRRQTLAFKAFLISGFTIFGLVVGADNALLAHEQRERIAETALRKEARIDLARQGKVGTETEIAKWKTEREDRERAMADSSRDSVE